MNQDLQKRVADLFEENRDILVRHFHEESGASGICESPIESLLASAIRLQSMLGVVNFGSFCLFEWFACRPITYMTADDFKQISDGSCHIYVAPQVEAAPYRVDFLCGARIGGKLHLLAVECDGHDFHERTKEQAMRDKSRDRWLLGQGIPVMRFTGTEIWKDPMACVEQIDTYFFDMRRRYWQLQMHESARGE